MQSIPIHKGLDLAIAGVPEPSLSSAAPVTRTALLACDYPGLRPTMVVTEGEGVALGQILFRDKRNPRVAFVSPGSGRVKSIHRGDKRSFVALEIALEGEREERFTRYPLSHLPNLSRELVVETLLASGLWPALRRRPYERIADPDSAPDALFVTAIDTQPLAADPQGVIARRPDDFRSGLQVLSRLTDGPVYVCQAEGSELPLPEGFAAVAFKGPHPAGLPGTHIHCLHPVNARRCVWHIGYQDVIAAGHLFTTGRILTERIVALGGPAMARPRLVPTRLGAALDDLLRDELTGQTLRVVSGSVLDGHSATGPEAFLGRYHLQVTALAEAHQSRLLGWLPPFGGQSWLGRGIFAAKRPRPVTTAAHGAPRAIYSIGSYEQVMPLDLSISYLLRALAAGDTDEAQALGALELAESDLALCSFVCPGKNDFGPLLRAALDRIERDG